MNLQLLFIALSLIFSSLTAAITYQADMAYETCELSHIPEEILEKVRPYLIPKDHPVKLRLDAIFKSKRALKSKRAMDRAGFFSPKPAPNHMIVTSHSRLPGYLIKAYLDTYNFKEWPIFCQRAYGAKSIQDEIDMRGYNHFFKVPKKWIYPLPEYPAPSKKENTYRKYFVLVVEDMHLLPQFQNEWCYKNCFSKEKLEALYTLLVQRKLIDSVFTDNIPFCQDGKIAFVDLEHYDVTSYPLRLHLLTEAFNQKMGYYWSQLIQNGIQ